MTDDKIRSDSEESIRIALESRYLQNPLYGRDALPHPIHVKQYFLSLRNAGQDLEFDDVGVGVFSQNNEDGILLFIFSKLGFKTRRCIEIGCDLSGSTVGIPEANTINLLINFGFEGLIIDRDEEKIGAIRHFFSQALTTRHLHIPSVGGRPARYSSPTLISREITVENINDAIGSAGFEGEVDLLSIDFDGPDVEAWLKLTIVNPRVVVVEVNSRLPLDQVIYGTFTTSKAPSDTLEFQSSRGSTLAAACEVAATKDYVFVGMDVTLLNAFFVRRDVWNGSPLPERFPADYLNHRFNPLFTLGLAGA